MGEAVSRPGVDFTEALADSPARSVPLAHLSLELGHLYFEDLAAGREGLREYFRDVAAWADAVRAAFTTTVLRGGDRIRPRVSTCFLVDDYFGPSEPPAAVLPMLVGAAADSGLRIDYLARESACADADGVPLAELVQDRIVSDPPPGTNGSRPPVSVTGWLCNGARSPATGAGTGEAMRSAVAWEPPAQHSATRHSVFVDVELWSEKTGGRRIWSCAYLAAVWQLLRLGSLRHRGEPVAVPRRWSEDGYPEEWHRLPAVIQLEPSAAPFAAYRTVSILPRRFLTTEHAVRTILDQIALDGTVVRQAVDRAAGEGIPLSTEAADRIEYVFVGDPPAVSRSFPGQTPTAP